MTTLVFITLKENIIPFPFYSIPLIVIHIAKGSITYPQSSNHSVFIEYCGKGAPYVMCGRLLIFYHPPALTPKTHKDRKYSLD